MKYRPHIRPKRRLDVSDGKKLCPTCKTRKPFSEFHKSISNRLGITSNCRPCVSASHRAKRLAGYVAPGNKARCQRYYRQHRERLIAKAAAWGKANPERQRLQKRIQALRYYRRKRRGGACFTAVQIQDLFVKQAGLCVGCTVYLDRYEIDHILAVSKGGTDEISNIQLLCRPCNRFKAAKSQQLFLEEMIVIRAWTAK